MAGEIFISYRRADEPYARLLYNRLKEHGVEAWYDAHVGAGEDWRTATARALQNARIFVLLFSRAAAASDDITKELAAATFSKKLIVPVRLEDIQPEGAFLYELAGRNWINAFEETEAKVGELARSLAGLVKSGKQDPAMLPFDRGAGRARTAAKKRSGGLRLIAGAGAAVAAIVAVAAFLLLQPKAAAPNQRFAFFGFDSDSDLAQAASVATDTMFKTLTSERMDTAARAETLGTDANKRLERAAALGAQYALTGEIRRVEGGRLKASVQLVDVPSKTALWPAEADAPADNPSLLADRIAYRITPVAKCTGNYRSTLSHDEPATVRLLPGACENVTLWSPPNLAIWRDLAARTPESAAIQSSFVSMLSTSRFPGADFAQLLKEARVAAARVEAAAPGSAAHYRIRYSMTMWEAPNYAEAEAILLEGLKRWPDDSWLNYNYAALLRGVGRVKDSEVPMRASAASDPLSPLKQTYLARTLAAGGVFPAESRRIYDRVLNVSQFYIAWYSLYGTLPLDSEDSINAIIAVAPQNIQVDQVDCARTAAMTVRALKRTSGKATDVALGCDIGSIIRPDMAFGLFSYADDVDAAFAAVNISMLELPVGETIFLFLPAARAARLDPRFEELAEKLGLMDYWRTTGRLPDFCQTEAAPVCEKLRKGRN